MSLLDTLIFGYRQVVDGTGALVLQRNKIKFVGAGSVVDDVTNAQTIVTLTGNSSLGPDGSGNSNITGEVNNTSNANAPTHEYNVNTLLATGAATVIKTIATTSNVAYSVRGIVRCHNSTLNVYGEWEINCYVRNVAGTVAISGTAVTQKQNSTTLALTFTVSGTNLVVTATNEAAATRRWTGTIYVAATTY